MQIYRGQAVSTGLAQGKIFYFCQRRGNFIHELIDDIEIEEECSRLDESISLVDAKLKRQSELFHRNGQEQEEVLTEAHRLLLCDIVEQGGCREFIREKKYSAGRAVYEVGTQFRLQFESMEDDFMRERAMDIRTVVELLLQELGEEKSTFPKLSEPVILVAEEVIPEGTLCFEKEHILAMVIRDGTYHSHAAILSRLWNIPALVGIVPEEDWNGRMATVDGSKGILYIEDAL